MLLFKFVHRYFPDCGPGWYGVNCASQCGHCVGGNLTCDVVNGTCPGGCEDGFSSRTCDVYIGKSLNKIYQRYFCYVFCVYFSVS